MEFLIWYLEFVSLIELSSADKESYNRFVAESSSGSFLQSWEWGQWQEALGREVIRYKILDDSGEQIASIQLIKMRLVRAVWAGSRRRRE